MNNVSRFVVVLAVLFFFLVSPAYAELTGSTRDVGRYGLEAVAQALYAVAVAIVIAGTAIGLGLRRQKK